MNAAICLLLYGAALAWLSPPLLRRVTRSGASPILAVVIWVSAVVLAVGAWVAVGVGLVLDVTTGRLDDGAVEYCMEAVSALTRAGAVGRLVLAAAGLAAAAVSVVVLRRIMFALRRFWMRSRDHADDARVVGARTHDVVVVTADRPAAYCVAGRPHAIVLTTGALATLDHEELAAVLAHERAHLSGRHLQLMMLLRALAAAMPRLPLFRSAVRGVSRLVEMCADDSAVRRHGPDALLRGLVALVGPSPMPGNVLGAADTAVVARVVRLTHPMTRAARLRQRIVLATLLVALFATPVAVSALCHY